MKAILTGGTCAAVVMAAGMAAFAQSTGTSAPTQGTPPQGTTQQEPQAPRGDRSQDDERITLVGCVERESEFRAKAGAGKGGVAGTDAGVGNEFILTKAMAAPDDVAGTSGTRAGTPPTGTSPANPSSPEPVGTSGATAGATYELTGPAEGDLEEYVGKRVAIVGKKKDGEHHDRPAVSGGTTGTASGAGSTGTSGTTTGTAGAPPAGGTGVTGQDLNLREIEVLSVREAPGSCDR